ncbi:hypothetical protein PRZ48_004384 [Zasmidium cellare]|uniref:Membrane-associated protein n=1 Tax=Zasmidium cellare TaxID=395010 RepID=A0ABR0EPH4_ZASCE|nr:hypothetical protein PRZ48_004384 [Zasmidium cellare]
MARSTMLRYTRLFFMFMCFLSVAVTAVPIVADAKNTDQTPDHNDQQTKRSSKAAQDHWVDMFDNIQPLPTMPTSTARSTAAAKPLEAQRHKGEHLQSYQGQHQRPETDGDTNNQQHNSAWQEEISGFNGPFAQFITSQYGTNLNITDIYMRGFSCGLASVVAAVAVVTSLYVVVGPLIARMWWRAQDSTVISSALTYTKRSGFDVSRRGTPPALLATTSRSDVTSSTTHQDVLIDAPLRPTTTDKWTLRNSALALATHKTKRRLRRAHAMSSASDDRAGSIYEIGQGIDPNKRIKCHYKQTYHLQATWPSQVGLLNSHFQCGFV